MKKWRYWRPLAFIAILATACSCGAAQTPPSSAPAAGANAGGKIVVRPSMVVNESAQGDAFALFDEQALAGDPRAGSKAEPKTFWTAGWNKIYYPLTAFVDLGAEYQMTDICVYDTTGVGDFHIESGTPFHWKPLLTDPLNHYQTWNIHPVDVRARYLRFTIADPGMQVPEIVLYGKPLGPISAVKIPAPTPHLRPTMDQFIGTNAFIDDPLDKMSVAGYVREYHNWSWDSGDGNAGAPAYPHNLDAFNPSSAAGGNFWFFDDYYAKLKKAGITVCPAIQGNVKWLAGDDAHMNDKAAAPGQDAADPKSYAAHADHLFQFAARYGAARVPDALLKLAANQPRKSGLGLLSYYENQNEPDGWWRGREGYSSPYELAAQCSADDDGDQKRMGATFGVKNADPGAKLVLSGLAGTNLDYIKAMKVWADWNRHGDFPADVINLHHYSNNAADQKSGQVGVCPEADGLKEKMRAIVDYCSRYLPGREVWLTEFGYDTHPASVQRAPAIGSASAEEVQARWIVRSYLLLAAAGVDRAAQYMLRDVNPADATQFSTSGLVTQKGEWRPKPAWYYTYTLKNRLAGMRFDGEVPSGNPKVWIYRFRSSAGKGAYVLWSPTAENAAVAAFRSPKFTLSQAATLVEFANGETNGKASPLVVTHGSVSVDVSEYPVIVLVDALAR
ncbi:hypothetical protein CCAX7_13690 [Capsulimonas corticalis]|uniref:Uncharacterized protein n=1 Tax=Capsulimonas corticalis TaxID=2219043 RepID=A0A402D722_9BACT|nr:hypothetical protein [Capsulimonas corticalis]BDI29318.1 hypothetical protein CCAX7_13690 [Capsulimonas corticalis]